MCDPSLVTAQTNSIDESLETFGLKSAQPQQPAPVVTAVAINGDGSLLATAGDDHFVNLWRIDDGKLAHQLLGHGDWVRTVEFSPDGKLLALGRRRSWHSNLEPYHRRVDSRLCPA